jgi:hypothetical protein
MHFQCFVDSIAACSLSCLAGVGWLTGLTCTPLSWTVGAGFWVFTMKQPYRSKHAD